MSHRFLNPNLVFLGNGAMTDAIEAITKLGHKALIVTGSSMIKYGYCRQLSQDLSKRGVSCEIYDGVLQEPTDQMVEAGKSIYLNSQCDFIIGFGGGSPIDCAKAIGIAVTTQESISSYNGKIVTHSIPPLVAVPTTAGTGSETTTVTIINDTVNNIKMLIKGDTLMPAIAVIDPIFTYHCSATVTASSGLDALTHAIEAYTSRKAFAISDLFAISAVKRIFKYLLRAVKDGSDQEARNQMSLGSYEAGVSFSNSSVTIVHGMSRPIGALFHVPHGLSNAMLLPDCLEFAVDGAYERFANLGKAIGVASEEATAQLAAQSFIQAVRQLCKDCQVPTLKEYGINQAKFMESIDKMTTDALASGSPGNTIKEVTYGDIAEIYRKLW